MALAFLIAGTLFIRPGQAQSPVIKPVSEPVEVVHAPPTPASGNYDQLFEKYFGEEAKTAKAICKAESGLRPDALSPTSDYGLCQIHAPVHMARFDYDVQKLYDPETNIRIAAEIYRDRNYSFTPWTVYRTGKYKKFLE